MKFDVYYLQRLVDYFLKITLCILQSEDTAFCEANVMNSKLWSFRLIVVIPQCYNKILRAFTHYCFIYKQVNAQPCESILMVDEPLKNLISI